jgi:hypothetical protein
MLTAAIYSRDESDRRGASEFGSEEEKTMIRLKALTCFVCSLFAFFVVCAGTSQAAKISGTVTTTLTITEDSQLVGDVTCTVTGAACITIAASHVALDLNGFTITGQSDPLTACSGGGTGGESGLTSAGQTGVTIRGPGIVQRFRQFGISLSNATASTITGVTTATNCFSGIFLNGGSLNELDGNISIRNGNVSNPCGGI